MIVIVDVAKEGQDKAVRAGRQRFDSHALVHTKNAGTVVARDLLAGDSLMECCVTDDGEPPQKHQRGRR